MLKGHKRVKSMQLVKNDFKSFKDMVKTYCKPKNPLVVKQPPQAAQQNKSSQYKTALEDLIGFLENSIDSERRAAEHSSSV